MTTLDAWVTQFKPEPPLNRAKAYVMALSGGLDSVVCLHLLKRISTLPVIAVHVNHGLSPNAASWADFCHTLCDDWSIECHIESVSIVKAPRTSLEAQARELRYQALSKYIQADIVLVTAQHLDDQVETFLLQLLRGSGLDGLTAMPDCKIISSGLHWRPLLNFSRDDIHGYAVQYGLQWVEDESNQDVRFARNYLRQQVLPLLKQRWPQYQHNIQRSCAHLAEARQLLDTSANRLLSQASVQQYGYVGLNIASLQSLAIEQRNQLLRCWLRQYRIIPSTAQLTELLHQCSAALDKIPQMVIAGQCIVREHGVLFCLPNIAPPPAGYSLPVTLPDNIELPFSAGRLQVSQQAAGEARLRFPNPNETVSIRFRQGGEMIQLTGRQHRHALKKLLQQSELPSWQKIRLPLLFYGEQLVAVADLWIDARFMCVGAQSGLRLHYQADF